MGKVNWKKIKEWLDQKWLSLKEWFRKMWPPLVAWLIGVGLSFFPLVIKRILYKILGVPIDGIFHDVEVLYISVTAPAVFICYVMQEKYDKGNKLLIIMDMVFIIIGAITYTISKYSELISQKWPDIGIHGIDQLWPDFIKLFFLVVSLMNIFFYTLLPGINSSVKSKKGVET